MTDHFKTHQTSLTAPADAAETVTPSDTVDLVDVTRAIYVGGAGALRVVMRDGQTVTFANMQAGVCYPLRVQRVLATGTTATNLIGLR